MPRSIEELLVQQIRKSELTRERRIEAGQPCVNPVITISRSMGSGGRIVAGKVAEDLGFSLWDKELLDTIARGAAVSRRVVEAFDEKTVSEIVLLAHAAFGNRQMGDFVYGRHLARAVAEIASLGNAVILGRGANFLLPNALHVRIDASLERRIENMMNYESIDRRSAEARLRKSDKERARFVMRVFGKERVQDFRYDVAICMDKFTPDEAAEIIEAAHRAVFKVVSPPPVV